MTDGRRPGAWGALGVAVYATLAACAAPVPPVGLPPVRSPSLGPADARAPLSLATDGATLALAWTAGAPLHVVVAVLDVGSGSLEPALVEEVGAALPGPSAEPSVALAADGTLVLALRAELDGESRVLSIERPAGGVFPRLAIPDHVVSFPPRAYQPALAALTDGTVVLAFDQWTSTGFGVSVATRDRDGSWTRAADADDVLSPRVFHSNAPRLAAGTAGAALLTWYQSLGGPLLVHVRERDPASGAFAAVAGDGVVSLRDRAVESHAIANPRPAIGPRGEAAVVWTAEGGAGALPVYVAAREAGGAWRGPRDVEDTLSPAVGRTACAVPAFLPSGELVVAWQADLEGDWAVYAGRRRVSGATDPTPSALRLTPAGSRGVEPAIAVDASGAIAIASTEIDERGSRVVVRRGTSLEALGAPTLVSEPGEHASAPALVSLPEGLYVAYLAGPPFAARVRAARLSP